MFVSGGLSNHIGSTINDVPSSATIIGHLAETGQELNTVDYPALFNQIGYSFCDDLIFTADTNPIVIMTGPTTNGYTASGYKAHVSYPYWCAYKNDTSNPYCFLSATGYLYAENRLSFPSEKPISAYEYYVCTGVGMLGAKKAELFLNDVKFSEINKTSYVETVKTRVQLPRPIIALNFQMNLYIPVDTVGSNVTLNINLYSSVFTSFYDANNTFSTGDEVKCQAFGGSMHTGVTVNTSYWVRKSGSNFTLHPTLTDAQNNTNALLPTAVGTGTCKIYKVGKFKLKNSVNGIYTNFIKY